MTTRTIIIGAGMAGLLAGIRLRQRGDDNFAIYEKGDKVGGTWRENTYPGLACDTPAHSYAYSFALNPDWSSYYAPGPEIRDYFEDVARRFDLHRNIRFNAPIARCEWRDGLWHVTTRDGQTDQGEVLIAATGVLHHPMMPRIPGLSDFAGAAFHSARWDHCVPLDGKRIGVIGNGSTGVQIVSAMVGKVARLVHFQRTAQWIMPAPQVVYTEADKQAFRDNPEKILQVRDGPDAAARRARFTSAIIDVESPALREIEGIVLNNLEQSVRDPVLKEKLRPNYRAACKRMIFSGEYYAAIQQPNAVLETAGIERIEPAGVRMRDGTFHELDVLVLATGFRVDQFTRPIKVIGEGGQDLDDLWAEHPRAYYAVTVPGFPNLCLLNGPTGPVGNFSLIDIAEKQWDYFDQVVEPVRQGKARGVAPSMAALLEYEAKRSETARKTVFASGCQSWYLDAKGEPQVWPWSWAHFVEVMARPNFADYVVTGA